MKMYGYGIWFKPVSAHTDYYKEGYRYVCFCRMPWHANTYGEYGRSRWDAFSFELFLP